MNNYIFLIACTFLLHGIQAACPVLSATKPIDMKGFTLNNNYTLHKYQSVDDSQIKSPFFYPNMRGKLVTLDNQTIKADCGIENKQNVARVIYSTIKLMNFNETTRSLSVQHDDQNSILCNAKYKMDKVYVVDFEVQKFLSIYGCEVFMINGILTEFVGVTIFLGDAGVEADLNYTYKILENEANISTAKLIHHTNASYYSKITESCKIIRENEIQCRKVANDQAEDALENTEFVVLWCLPLLIIFISVNKILIAKLKQRREANIVIVLN